MFEKDTCEDCAVGRSWCINSCLPSQGSASCKIAIYFPYPDFMEDKRGRSFVGQRAEFVGWLLKKMGIGIEQVYMDYIVKCAPGKLMPKNKEGRMEIVRSCRQFLIASLQNLPKLRSVVALGSLPCEVLCGHTQVGSAAGWHLPPYEPNLRGKVDHVWVAYDPLYAIEKPVESGAIFRVIYKAASEAGLGPNLVKGVPAFDFGK